jgi:hypothetical protein
MLRFIVRADHLPTIESYRRNGAGSFASRVTTCTYDALFRARRIPLVTHVFTDLESLTPEERENAAFFWNALSRSASQVRLLNHPLVAMRRYELLRHMHESGVNDFDVYRLTEGRVPVRFPVFLRVEDDHAGPSTNLIGSREDFEEAVANLRRGGKCAETRLVVESSSQAGPDGLYRKYGVFYVDGAVIPQHVLFSPQWLVKGGTAIRNEQTAAEQARFLAENPHAREIREIFRSAHIDYGRIDYAIVKGRLQVYEIATNPTIMDGAEGAKPAFSSVLTESFRRLEESTPQTGRRTQYLKLDPPLKDWRGRLASRMCHWFFGRQFRSAV